MKNVIENGPKAIKNTIKTFSSMYHLHFASTFNLKLLQDLQLFLKT